MVDYGEFLEPKTDTVFLTLSFSYEFSVIHHNELY